MAGQKPEVSAGGVKGYGLRCYRCGVESSVYAGLRPAVFKPAIFDLSHHDSWAKRLYDVATLLPEVKLLVEQLHLTLHPQPVKPCGHLATQDDQKRPSVR